MKRGILVLSIITLLHINSYACFDTYLFLRKASMVYPYKSLVLEANGEYSFTKFNDPSQDQLFTMGSIYYGLLKDFSIQLTIGSSEKPRGEFALDAYSIRGVYNLFTSKENDYNFNLIFEHRGMTNRKANEIEISTPLIHFNDDFTYIIHPTMSYGLNSQDLTIGGHLGFFYNFNPNSLIGIGAEYASVQSSSYGGQRLTQSEFSTSLFFGTYIGNRIYLQNEFAKGLANSRDFGLAITTKFIIN
ncbi:MAG: hypothetical protein N3F03_08410 [Ignavibacteria bacterium]|nr:hypothetical protein [Ignavibacteria bacterium]